MTAILQASARINTSSACVNRAWVIACGERLGSSMTRCSAAWTLLLSLKPRLRIALRACSTSAGVVSSSLTGSGWSASACVTGGGPPRFHTRSRMLGTPNTMPAAATTPSRPHRAAEPPRPLASGILTMTISGGRGISAVSPPVDSSKVPGGGWLTWVGSPSRAATMRSSAARAAAVASLRSAVSRLPSRGGIGESRGGMVLGRPMDEPIVAWLPVIGRVPLRPSRWLIMLDSARVGSMRDGSTRDIAPVKVPVDRSARSRAR